MVSSLETDLLDADGGLDLVFDCEEQLGGKIDEVHENENDSLIMSPEPLEGLKDTPAGTDTVTDTLTESAFPSRSVTADVDEDQILNLVGERNQNGARGSGSDARATSAPRRNNDGDGGYYKSDNIDFAKKVKELVVLPHFQIKRPPKDKRRSTGGRRVPGNRFYVQESDQKCWVCCGTDHTSQDCKLKLCFKCNSYGHEARNCPNGHKVCRYCMTPGHDPIDCPVAEYERASKTQEIERFEVRCVNCGLFCGQLNCSSLPETEGVDKFVVIRGIGAMARSVGFSNGNEDAYRRQTDGKGKGKGGKGHRQRHSDGYDGYRRTQSGGPNMGGRDRDYDRQGYDSRRDRGSYGGRDYDRRESYDRRDRDRNYDRRRSDISYDDPRGYPSDDRRGDDRRRSDYDSRRDGGYQRDDDFRRRSDYDRRDGRSSAPPHGAPGGMMPPPDALTRSIIALPPPGYQQQQHNQQPRGSPHQQGGRPSFGDVDNNSSAHDVITRALRMVNERRQDQGGHSSTAQGRGNMAGHPNYNRDRGRESNYGGQRDSNYGRGGSSSSFRDEGRRVSEYGRGGDDFRRGGDGRGGEGVVHVSSSAR